MSISEKRYCVMVRLNDGTWKPSAMSMRMGGFASRFGIRSELYDLRRRQGKAAQPVAVVGFICR